MDKSGDILMKTQCIFTLPLNTVCDALDKLVAESSPQDLLHSLEFIVDMIYGPNARWDLRLVTVKTDEVSYRFLLQFLHPDGPVFRLIYKLVTFWDTKTVYNLTEYLCWARDLFEEGMPEYFMDKVSIDERTRRITHMSLNAFELYIFHYAYYVVNPWLQKTGISSPIHESVYMELCVEYLAAFLPFNSNEVSPFVDVTYSSLRNTLPRHNQASYRSDLKPCKFRQSALRNTADMSPQPYIYNLLAWRSEAVFYIFSYVWLNYGKQDPTTGSILREPPPSVDHVRVVRTMVKHYHYFANSAVGDMSALDALKRIVRPVCGDKIYRFLRRSIYNWPLDTSFRVILEAWLSYIQPWRYTDFAQYGSSTTNLLSQDATKDRAVDRIWHGFIAEYLLAYTVIYQQVLPRFFRLDLTSSQNAMMINRVTKVFSQQNLNIMIAEVESCLLDQSRWEKEILDKKDTSVFPVATMDGTPVAVLVENSPSVVINGKQWYAKLFEKLVHLEGNQYSYTPMFRRDTDEVYKLLDTVMAAYISSYFSMMAAEREAAGADETFFSTVMRFLSMRDYQDACYTPLDDRKRVVSLLNQVLNYIAHIYNVPVPTIPDTSSLHSVVAPTSTPCQPPTVTKVSPVRWHVELPKTSRRPTPSYQGNPDLMPIMSNECAFLVRMLHKIATKINNKFSLEISQLFHRPGFVGGVARQIISPPRRVRYYDRNVSAQGHPQLLEASLPPRLSLRWMASYSFLSCVIILIVLSHFFLGNWSSLLISVYALWLIYIAFRALLEPFLPIIPPERTEPTSESREFFDLDVSM
ncbi:sphingomyelin phosphodiesterase 4 [Anabrus simplex]|uniref:sphingomyelin phosphodiesterase 4 n=1 Tax=Anabrus simplex TaxID=316456 RepID=UPI0035A26EED